jgi:hypothetical protein
LPRASVRIAATAVAEAVAAPWAGGASVGRQGAPAAGGGADPVAALLAARSPAPWPPSASPWGGLPAVDGGAPEAFYLDSERSRIATALVRVVEAAGPVPIDDAYKAVIAAYWMSRLGSRLRDVLDVALASRSAVDRPRVRGEHLWPGRADPAAWTAFRYADGSVARDAASIAPEEVAAAAAWVLERGVTMSREALARECASIFGASSLGRKIRDAMDAGVAALEASGRAVADGEGRLTWVGDGSAG